MIVYLAWGSLFWSPEDLPINNWIYSDLKLPLEYSRISDQGKGRLTLVIDNKNGTNNRIWYAKVNINNIDNAISRLKKREKTTLENIAYINLKNNKKRIKNTPDNVAKNIEKWAKINNIDAIIWTDLKSNWEEIMHTKYTLKKAYKYFNQSDLQIRLKILEYIYYAKNFTHINTKFSQYFFEQLSKT
jgi:hypothetical protein